MRRVPILALISFLLACAAPLSHPARADDSHAQSEHEEEDVSRDALRRMVQDGKILPLGVLKAKVLAQAPGELINVSVDRDEGRMLYEFRILTSGGKVTEVEVDAATGNIIEIEND
ncbi:PepSY domain-containing protein [Rhizobium sp. FKL33]|uniref:PepSY domain-containing protein n=1 Tax=Rhizobium sp. FKL33 TaxID=2562307 RepID=UPI0010C09FFA|nr:PepSY domain-containing protein [Rhizobium sp. FKL33]